MCVCVCVFAYCIVYSIMVYVPVSRSMAFCILFAMLSVVLAEKLNGVSVKYLFVCLFV